MKKLSIVDDAATIARRAWSMRFIYLGTLLGALDQFMPMLQPEKPSRLFGLAAIAVTVAAGVARVVAQPKMRGDR